MSHGLFNNRVAMLTALAALAPEVNVRVALINFIDYLAEMQPGDEMDREDIYEVITQNLVFLHDHVGEDEDEELRGASMEEALNLFRRQLGIEEEDK